MLHAVRPFSESSPAPPFSCVLVTAIILVLRLVSRKSIFSPSQEEGKGAGCMGLESNAGQTGEWLLDREDSSSATAVPELGSGCQLQIQRPDSQSSL